MLRNGRKCIYKSIFRKLYPAQWLSQDFATPVGKMLYQMVQRIPALLNESIELIVCGAMSDKLMVANVMANKDQWPLLLTWFNFNPNMDK